MTRISIVRIYPFASEKRNDAGIIDIHDRAEDRFYLCKLVCAELGGEKDHDTEENGEHSKGSKAFFRKRAVLYQRDYNESKRQNFRKIEKIML